MLLSPTTYKFNMDAFLDYMKDIASPADRTAFKIGLRHFYNAPTIFETEEECFIQMQYDYEAAKPDFESLATKLKILDLDDAEYGKGAIAIMSNGATPRLETKFDTPIENIDNQSIQTSNKTEVGKYFAKLRALGFDLFDFVWNIFGHNFSRFY